MAEESLGSPLIEEDGPMLEEEAPGILASITHGLNWSVISLVTPLLPSHSPNCSSSSVRLHARLHAHARRARGRMVHRSSRGRGQRRRTRSLSARIIRDSTHTHAHEHMTNASAGAITGGYHLIAFVVANPVFGTLSDYTDRRKFLVFGLLGETSSNTHEVRKYPMLSHKFSSLHVSYRIPHLFPDNESVCPDDICKKCFSLFLSCTLLSHNASLLSHTIMRP